MNFHITRPDMAGKPPAQFWNELFDQVPVDLSEIPVNVRLAELVDGLPAGTALDLGCGLGGDTMWLARHGWDVTATDISSTAVRRLEERAAREGLAARVHAEQRDLATSRPGGEYDLITAHYLHSLFAFPRADILHALSAQVKPSGWLLVVDHGSVAPWSWNQGADVPTPEQTLAELALDETVWHTVVCEARSRTATGPGGQTAEVLDNIIFLRRHPFGTD